MTRPQRARGKRRYLPGIADIRICADEATTARILHILESEFRTTTPQPYNGGRTYLQLDTGCTEPDVDAP
ncbi:hypothetical protein [Streptomyces sp. NPDC059076]|uniref:hypothetical protein n=1 Tax=unclassified Streptomyces TaxID=2593676 RepID=UPI0036A0BFCD